MQIRLSLRRSTFSYWLIFFFFIVLILAAGISEFYQTPKYTTKQFNEYRTLFRDSDLNDIETIIFKNRLGDFTLQFDAAKTPNQWQIIKPRSLPAKSDPINLILKILKDIKIRKVYQTGPINVSNFSLDFPRMEIEFIKQDPALDSLKIKFGLSNFRDNSTYTSVSGRDAIFHIDSLPKSLEQLDLTDFVDSRIVFFNPSQVAKLESFRYFGIKARTTFKIIRPEDTSKAQFTDSNGNALVPERVTEFMNELSHFKGHIILDEMGDELQKKLEIYLNTPTYSLTWEGFDGVVHTIKVSQIINKHAASLKIPKNQFVLLTSSDRPYPYIVSKVFIKFFEQKTAKFRELNIKKLFY